MRLRVLFLNLWLRQFVRRRLSRVRDVALLRAAMTRDAARHLTPPSGTRFTASVFSATGDTPAVAALWTSTGRPDRHKVILYLHGGAYLAGSSETHRAIAARLAECAGARAVLPDYRRAPEHPFPAAVEDAVRAWRGLLDTGYTPDRIAIAGDSAGGGLAFATVLALQTAGLPGPACVVAFSPWADLTLGAASLRRNAARDAMLPAARIGDAAALYLGKADAADPLASPVFGTFLAPPPSLIFASTSEILEDDARTLAHVLRDAGGDVRLELWPRLPHAWPVFWSRLPEGDAALRHAGAFISAAFEPS